MSACQPFRSRYSAFKPYALRGDAHLDAANEKAAPKFVALYPQVSEKLMKRG
jgi:hypothetical protein